MKAHRLDQRPDLRLGAAEPDCPATRTEPAGQHREVEHQRGIGEHELSQIDDHLRLRLDRPSQRATPAALSRAVLIATAAQYQRYFLEGNDLRTLLNAPNHCQQAHRRPS